MIDTWPEGKYESLILCFDTILFYFITTITKHVLLRNYLNRILSSVEIILKKIQVLQDIRCIPSVGSGCIIL